MTQRHCCQLVSLRCQPNTVCDTCVSFTFFSKTLDPLATKNGTKEVNTRFFDSLADVYLIVRFSLVFITICMQQACNDHYKLTLIWQRKLWLSLVAPCWWFTAISKISSVKVLFFQCSRYTYFLKYFRGKFREILTSGSREIHVFQCLTFYPCATFN